MPIMPRLPTPSGSSIASASGMEGGGGAGKHYRNRDDEMHSGGGRLKRYGGLITGFADTFAGAMEATRAEIIAAVDGDEPVETEIVVNGNRGTDNPGGSTNRIESEEHDREAVDRVFLALTTEQFEALGDRLDARVTAR